MSIALRGQAAEFERSGVQPSRRLALPIATAAGLVCALAIGSFLLAYADRYAARHADGDPVHFGLFWAGELVFLLPALACLLAAGPSRAQRLLVVTAIGFFDYLPKYLRDPSFPLFHDELLHRRELAQVLASGQPFRPSPLLGVIEYYPGLHTATAAIVKLSGASPFTVVSVLLACLHVTALLGVFLLGEGLAGSARVGGLTAFAYALNPSFLFFDVQFSYESLASVFVIWVLVALARAEVARSRAETLGWLALGALLGIACVVTHHLSSFALAAILLLTALIAQLHVRRRRRPTGGAGIAGLLALIVTTAAVAWTLLVAAGIVAYISPHLSGGLEQLIALIGREHTTKAHTLFAGSVIPDYERAAGFLAPPLVLAASLFSLRGLRRYRVRSVLVDAFVCLAALYFLSLPLIYTTAGNEGARRSWAFSYLGIAFLLAVAAERAALLPGGRIRLALLAGLTVLVATVVMVGNVGGGTNPYYRFPGPVSTRSDIRMLTPELRAGAGWLKETQPAPRLVLTDQFSSPGVAYYGDARPASPSAGFRTWQLFLDAGLPRPAVAAQLRSSGFTTLLARAPIPLSRGFYSTEDSVAPSAKTTAAAIARFDRTRWLLKLYASEQLAIYRIDPAALARAEKGMEP